MTGLHSKLSSWVSTPALPLWNMQEHTGSISSFEAMLRGNPEIKEILRILKIKHLSSLQEVTPEQKLLEIMLLSAVSIH